MRKIEQITIYDIREEDAKREEIYDGVKRNRREKQRRVKKTERKGEEKEEGEEKGRGRGR